MIFSKKKKPKISNCLYCVNVNECHTKSHTRKCNDALTMSKIKNSRFGHVLRNPSQFKAVKVNCIVKSCGHV